MNTRGTLFWALNLWDHPRAHILLQAPDQEDGISGWVNSNLPPCSLPMLPFQWLTATPSPSFYPTLMLVWIFWDPYLKMWLSWVKSCHCYSPVDLNFTYPNTAYKTSSSDFHLTLHLILTPSTLWREIHCSRYFWKLFYLGNTSFSIISLYHFPQSSSTFSFLFQLEKFY